MKNVRSLRRTLKWMALGGAVAAVLGFDGWRRTRTLTALHSRTAEVMIMGLIIAGLLVVAVTVIMLCYLKLRFPARALYETSDDLGGTDRPHLE